MKLHVWNLLQNNIHPFLLILCFLSSSVISDATEWGPNFFIFIFVIFQNVMVTILFSITGLVILSPNGWFQIIQIRHFWVYVCQFWSQIGDLRPVKTPGNYDVGACQNKLTCTCFLIKITSVLVEAVNKSACPVGAGGPLFRFEGENNWHYTLRISYFLCSFKRSS